MKKGRPSRSKVAALCCGRQQRRRGRFPVGVMVRSQDGRRHHHDNNAAANSINPTVVMIGKDAIGDAVDSSKPHELPEQAYH